MQLRYCTCFNSVTQFLFSVTLLVGIQSLMSNASLDVSKVVSAYLETDVFAKEVPQVHCVKKGLWTSPR